MVRAKMCLTSVRNYVGWAAKSLEFSCEYDQSIPEDQRFAKATPNGQLTILVDNPAALEKFELGKSYYLDFTPVD